MSCTIYDKGRAPFPGTEGSVAWHDRWWTHDSAVAPAIYCHQALTTALSPFAATGDVNDLAVRAIIHRLGRRGVPCITSDQAGTSSWSNAAAVGTVGNALTYAGARLGSRSDKAVLFGTSMGSLLALNYTQMNPSKVLAVAVMLPIPDLEWVHDNGPAPIPANIETAFGGLAAYNAAKAGYNPMNHTANFAGVPVRMWYSDDDPTAVPERAIAFATATGATIESLGAVGHTLTGIDADAVADWLAEFAL